MAYMCDVNRDENYRSLSGLTRHKQIAKVFFTLIHWFEEVFFGRRY